jgi:hypothetical protein
MSVTRDQIISSICVQGIMPTSRPLWRVTKRPQEDVNGGSDDAKTQANDRSSSLPTSGIGRLIDKAV